MNRSEVLEKDICALQGRLFPSEKDLTGGNFGGSA